MSAACDRPSEVWQVMDRHQRTFAFVAAGTYREARAAVRSRPDLRALAELRESEISLQEQCAEARHPSDERTGPWSSCSFLLADGSY